MMLFCGFLKILCLKWPKFSFNKCFCEHFIAVPKLLSTFCAEKAKQFQRKHSVPFWIASCCFATFFLLFVFYFFFSPSYINSVSSSFWDRWWAGDTNELPAAQGRQSEMVCVLRVNRLSTLTKDVTRTWWRVWCTTYCSRLSSHQPMSCVSPREQIPKTAYLIVQTLLCLWGHCCERCNNLLLIEMERALGCGHMAIECPASLALAHWEIKTKSTCCFSKWFFEHYKHFLGRRPFFSGLT